MDDFVMPLMLGLDVQSLAMSLVNIESPRGGEGPIADSLEAALRSLAHLEVERVGDTVLARASAGRGERVIVAVHTDAPESEEPPLAYVEMGKLFGPGASDAKGCAAVALKVAAHASLARDVTFVFHDAAFDPASSGADLAADLVLVAAPTASVVRGSDSDGALAQSLVALTDAPASSAAVDGPWAALGAPVIAFGPGDPSVAGTDGEFTPTAELGQCEYVLRTWLTA